MALTGVTKPKGPSGVQHAVIRKQQEVTRPKARLKPTYPKKSGVDGGAISCQHILVSCFNYSPHGDLVYNLPITALVGSALVAVACVAATV